MTESGSKIGIALSGGGNRAALFGVGTLMYFVDVGKNRTTSAVSSVSGGSLANGFVAQSGPFDQQTPESFRSALKPLIRCMARSSPLWGWWGTWLYLFVVVVAIAAVIGIWWFVPLSPWMKFLELAVGLAVIDRVLIYKRPVIVSWAFRAKLYHGKTGTTLLAKLPDSSVDHVYCTTDLHTGKHVYFSRDFVYAFKHGGGTPARLTLHTAVQASSCFPGALPARWIRTRQFCFPPQTEEIKLPWMALADGGVYDNMAEQYLSGIDSRKKRRDGFSQEIVQPDEFIIVNSSGSQEVSSLWQLKLPYLLGELFGLLRVVNTLFDNTTTTRRSSLFHQFEIHHDPKGCFVMIERSPRFTAAALSDSKDADVAKRASNVLKLLDTQSVDWDQLAKANTHAPTTFRGLGVDRTTDLLWHGYLSAMCNTHVVLGYPLPEKIPSRADFLAYVQNS